MEVADGIHNVNGIRIANVYLVATADGLVEGAVDWEAALPSSAK